MISANLLSKPNGGPKDKVSLAKELMLFSDYKGLSQMHKRGEISSDFFKHIAVKEFREYVSNGTPLLHFDKMLEIAKLTPDDLVKFAIQLSGNKHEKGKEAKAAAYLEVAEVVAYQNHMYGYNELLVRHAQKLNGSAACVRV